MQEIIFDVEWLCEVLFFLWDEVFMISLEDGYVQLLFVVVGMLLLLEQGDLGVGCVQ